MGGILMSKFVAIDFDGTIVSYDEFKGRGVFGDPLPGVRKALQDLVHLDYRIIIHTTREEIQAIKAYLLKQDIPFHYVNENPESTVYHGIKPAANVYIDDKALTFKGVWDEHFVQQIVDFQPWHKKDNSNEQLIDDLLDLANYCHLTYALVIGKKEEGFSEGQARSKTIHEEKAKTHGEGFFSSGREGAYNDIRRKFLRLKYQLKKGEHEE